MLQRTISLPTLLTSLVAVVCLSGSGCWTSKTEGEALRRDVDKLKAELSKTAERSKQERVKLQEVMEQATALLTRNSADVGAQVERIQAKQAKLSGQLEEATRTLDELKTGFNVVKGKVEVKQDSASARAQNTPATPTDKDELFKLAEHKVKVGRHKEGRRLLKQFLDNFPQDQRAAQAQLIYGNSFFAQQKFAPAIIKYKGILEKHESSQAHPEALFKIGMAFYQLKYCSDADLWLKQFLAKYKRHSQAPRAKKVRNLIKRYRRNRDFCR